MGNNNIQDRYPLSPLQQGMLFTRLYQPDSGVDIQQMLFNVREPFDQSAFDQAWTQVIDRHEILRTRFQWDNMNEPLQVVQTKVLFSPAVYDWRQLTKKERELKLEEFFRDVLSHRRNGFLKRCGQSRLNCVRDFFNLADFYDDIYRTKILEFFQEV